MSDYKTHLLVGSLLVAILTTILYFTTNLIILDSKTLIMIVMIAYIFPLLPDLDTRASTIVWSFLGIGIFGISITILNNYYHFLNNGSTILISSIILLILTFICAKYAGHRGPIHTIRAGIIFSALSWFITTNITLCFIAFAGYYSHLVMDGIWKKI